MLDILTRNGIEFYRAQEFWTAEEALSVIFGVAPCGWQYWPTRYHLEYDHIPSPPERQCLWLEILKAVKDKTLQAYQPPVEEDPGEEEREETDQEEEAGINWDLIWLGNRSQNGYESDLNPPFRHYAFGCFTLDPKEYVAWFTSTQTYEIHPAFRVQKKQRRGL